MESIVCKPKRIVFARFDEGDDLLLCLKKCAVEHGIRSGWFDLIGALKKISYGLYINGEHRKVSKRAENCFEILSAFGNITQKEGDVLVHAHLAVSDENDRPAFGGHLLEGCEIYPFAEVVIQEIDTVIHRRYDKKINLWPLKFN